ncbi:MAG: cation:proton antiporter [Pseudobdellovibrionaceae bacterium]
MVHVPQLIHDLGIILITAAVTTVLFRYLKQPVVLGYLVAGFLVSPHVGFHPTVIDVEGIKIWAEIGVIFLLFSLGLEFSFRKLLKVGPSASITAVFEIVFMMALGYLTGQLLGWSMMDSLFLGGVLAISSTTIIIRALEELGMKKRAFVSLVFAALIVEDLVAIFLMVLLSTVASASESAGAELALTSLKLPFFMVLWFLFGIYILPNLFKTLRKFLNEETLLIVCIGLCLGMVMIATQLNFSPALGAFIMGSLIAETREGRRVEHTLMPVKNLFGAIFFVSVGMMIEPRSLLEHWKVITLLTALTIFGKIFSTSLGALLAGRSLRHSVQAGFSLAQIGEFSFIIATLGLSLKVTSDFLYPIAVAVSAITTFTTPYLIKASDPVSDWLSQKLPASFLEKLVRYQQSDPNKKSTGFVRQFLQDSGFVLLFNSVLVLAIVFSMKNWVYPIFPHILNDELFGPTLFSMLTLTLAFPFIWEIIGIRRLIRMMKSPMAMDPFLVTTTALRGILGFILILTAILLLPGNPSSRLLVLFLLPVLVYFGHQSATFIYQKMEMRFRKNLSETETEPSTTESAEAHRLAPWNTSLAQVKISPQSSVVGKTLAEAKLREHFGVTVVMILRGKKSILPAQRGDFLFPGDQVLVLGTDQQISEVSSLLESEEGNHEHEEDIQLEPILVSDQSPLLGKTIRDSQIRELTHGIVVGIERAGKRILNPESSFLIQAKDLIWIVGKREAILGLGK